MAKRIVRACLLLAATAVSTGAAAVELYQFDRNGDNKLDAEEIRVRDLHRKEPIYGRIDVIDVDGEFSPEELALFYQQSRKGLKPTALVRKAEASGPIPLPDVNDIDVTARCGESGFYVRGTPVAGSDFRPNAGVSNPRGVSVVTTGAQFSITADEESTTASINGVVGYAFNENCIRRPEGFGPDAVYVSGYVISPWLLGSGTLFDSEEPDGTDKLQAGLAGQIEIADAIFDTQYLTATPYYQTDFQGEAQIYGGSLSWRPYASAIRLGGTTKPKGAILDLYWTAAATADYFYVADAGATALTEGTEYAWLGGILGVNGWILPDTLKDRLSFTSTYGMFWDAYSHRSVDTFNASLNWAFSKPEDPNQFAIALGYQNGTDRNTLVDVNQWTLGLTFKH